MMVNEMKMHKGHDVATQEFNKTVCPGRNQPREYEVKGSVVSGKKGFLPTLDGVYPVIYKPKSYVRNGLTTVSGRGASRGKKY
jgi:hypothetical protein